MSMLDCLVTLSASHDVYHMRPPTGCALLAMQGSWLFSVVEWAARLFIGPITPPFNLGAEQHKASGIKLDITKVKQCVELGFKQSIESSTFSADAGDGEAEVIWSTSPAVLRFQWDVGAVQRLDRRDVKLVTH